MKTWLRWPGAKTPRRPTTDPFAIPEVAAMSLRELADLPLVPPNGANVIRFNRAFRPVKPAEARVHGATVCLP